MIFYNARIFTGDEFIENGAVEFENGKITDVMTDYSGTDGEDMHGAFIYPGFIDAHTHVGMWEDGLSFEGDDGNEDTDPCTPQLRAIDAINPADRCFDEALKAGITAVVTGPGSANPVSGQSALLKTHGRTVDEMAVLPYCAMKMALGENPKRTYNDKDQTPVTRMATASIIREMLFKASRYNDDLRRYERDQDNYDKPEFDMKCEALIPVIRGEKPVHFHAHRADDICTAIRIAEEFDLDYVIVHATDGAVISDTLAKKHAKVLCGPVISERCKPEMRSLDISTAAKLFNAGIEPAIITDHPVIPLQYLSMCAAMCVKGGLSKLDALRAMTSIPAKILGIGDRIGALKKGMDADIVVANGDIFDIFTDVMRVYIGGERVV